MATVALCALGAFAWGLGAWRGLVVHYKNRGGDVIVLKGT